MKRLWIMFGLISLLSCKDLAVGGYDLILNDGTTISDRGLCTLRIDAEERCSDGNPRFLIICRSEDGQSNIRKFCLSPGQELRLLPPKPRIMEYQHE